MPASRHSAREMLEGKCFMRLIQSGKARKAKRGQEERECLLRLTSSKSMGVQGGKRKVTGKQGGKSPRGSMRASPATRLIENDRNERHFGSPTSRGAKGDSLSSTAFPDPPEKSHRTRSKIEGGQRLQCPRYLRAYTINGGWKMPSSRSIY